MVFYYIGFHSREALGNCLVASSALVGSFLVVRIILQIKSAYLRPFTGPISVLGNIILHLCLLIVSSESYTRDDSKFWKRNACMVLVTVGSILVGHVYGLVGMANVGTTYFVLYSMEKYAQFHKAMRWSGWVLMLTFSCVMYKSALYLHANPDHVAMMFQMTV